MNKSLLKQLTGQGFVYGISNIALKLIGFILFPLFARKFDPSDYGTIGVLNTLTFFAITLCTLGLDSAVSRWFFDNKGKKQQQTIFSNWVFMQFFVSVAALTILFVGYLIFGSISIVETSNGRLLLLVVCGNIILNILPSVLNLYFIINRKPIPAVSFAISSAIISAISSLFFVFVLDGGLIGFYLGQTISFFLYSIIGYTFYLRKLIKPLFINLRELKKMIRYGMAIVPATLSAQLLLFISSIIILSLTSQKELGYYQVGFTLATGISLFTIPFGQAFQPLSFSIMNKSEANQFYTLTFDLYCICLSVVCLFVGLFMKEIIAILLTNKYSDSLFVAAVLCFSNFIYSLNVIGATGMAREKKIYYFGIIVSAFNLITIGLIYFLTLLYGINGAATAFIFGQSMAIVFIFYYSQKAYFIPYRILANAFSIIISGLFFLVGYYSISIYPFLSLYIRVGLFLLFIVFLLICYKNIWVRAKMIFANVRSDSSKEIIDRNLNKHQTF